MCPMKPVALAMKWQRVWPTLQLLDLAVKNLSTTAFNTAFTDLTIQSYSCESDKSFLCKESYIEYYENTDL